MVSVTIHTRLTGIGAIKLEALTDPSLPGEGPGRGDAERPNFVLTSFQLSEAPESDPNSGREVPFTSARADFSQAKYDVSGAIDQDAKTGWAINPQFHKPHWAVFVTEQLIGSESGSVWTLTLEQNSGGARTIGRFKLSAFVGNAAGIAGPKVVPPDLKRLQDQHDKAVAALKKLDPPQTLVMKEVPEPRSTTMFIRGNFLDPGERVPPGTPSVLPPLKFRPTETTSAKNEPVPALTRLDLAHWLVDRDNPLVARVAVNRWWAELFGRGIVATPEDFGARGEPPTHPELIDWLAVELMKRGWSMKEMHRLIVTSATYRQSSRLTPELLAQDDQNRLYARGPRFRLDAEMIRDNALFAAGLLNLKLGGPAVKPYQPPGVWTVTGVVDNTYRVSEGPDAHRRGIYVIWRRSAPFPSFVNFDAPMRASCVVKRSRSNTPLQALTLLNDPVYIEAALALARRVLEERHGASVEERIRYAFRVCLTRSPSENEVRALANLLTEQLARFQADSQAAQTLLRNSPPPARTGRAEFAAWYHIAVALLNLDEMITKG